MSKAKPKARYKQPAEKEPAAPGDTGQTAGDAAEKTPCRLTGRQTTAGLAILAAIMLVFFLGMRWIDGRSSELPPPETAAQTLPDRAIPAEGSININTASLSELKKLSGIGDKKAQAIIDHRNEYGPFTAVEEIMEVEGIGEGTFAAIKDDICV